MRIITVVGTRPNLIKLDPHLTQEICWTGQHYNPEMGLNFFTELGLPAPKWNLGKQKLGEMVDALTELLKRERPSLVLVVGDTNSSVAGAIAAYQARIPVAHIEAGLRSGEKIMLEEQNRIVIDHLATLRFAPTAQALRNLEKEGLDGILTGDPMYSRLHHHYPTDFQKRGYVLLTVHRAETVDDPERMEKLIHALELSPLKFILPLHPRVREADYKFPKNVKVIPPQPYLKMINLIAQADKVLTDSGGVQREAAWLGVPVILLREKTEFPELVDSGHVTLVGTTTFRIQDALANFEGAGYPVKESHDAWKEIGEEIWFYLDP